MPTDLRPELPELPDRIKNLPVDKRGYPVPWFVTWLDEDDNPCPRGQGRPEFRVVDPEAILSAIRHAKCWVCGEKMGRYKAFTIGPMCAINRISSEPPAHTECAMFSARACPFLTRPHARRRDNALPEDVSEENVAGTMIRRNPGVAMVWVTTSFTPFKSGPGVLFDLGKPDEVLFFAEGRMASRSEVCDSIRSGYGALYEAAAREDAVDRLEEMRDAAFDVLPPLSEGEIPCAKCGAGVPDDNGRAEFRKPICTECFEHPPEKRVVETV